MQEQQHHTGRPCSPGRPKTTAGLLPQTRLSDCSGSRDIHGDFQNSEHFDNGHNNISSNINKQRINIYQGKYISSHFHSLHDRETGGTINLTHFHLFPGIHIYTGLISRDKPRRRDNHVIPIQCEPHTRDNITDAHSTNLNRQNFIPI
ncbi:hypothetical protein CB1_000823013 [Camelus ferus]|nr:hypothetical protein CB1_000823013 [Camelus ferus]